MDQTADLTTAGFARWSGGNSHERKFWIALACATVLHASLFIGAIASKPATLGDPSGSDQAISVSLVTEADLESRATVAEPPQPPPGPPPQPAQQPQPDQPPPPKPEAKQEAQPPQAEPPKPEEQEAKTESPPQPEDAKPADKPEQKVAKEEDPKSIDDAPDLLSLQSENPANMKSETKPKPQPKTETAKSAQRKAAKKTEKKTASLDLSTPKSLMQPSFGGGRSAGLQRPPGITRSGLNDAFARAVIRALQQTMPQLTDVAGRVTIRILLTESGDVSQVQLLSGAKNPSLTQDVVFAAKQTSYPIPPSGSNTADRTFMVTYIYD